MQDRVRDTLADHVGGGGRTRTRRRLALIRDLGVDTRNLQKRAGLLEFLSRGQCPRGRHNAANVSQGLVRLRGDRANLLARLLHAPRLQEATRQLGHHRDPRQRMPEDVVQIRAQARPLRRLRPLDRVLAAQMLAGRTLHAPAGHPHEDTQQHQVPAHPQGLTLRVGGHARDSGHRHETRDDEPTRRLEHPRDQQIRRQHERVRGVEGDRIHEVGNRRRRQRRVGEDERPREGVTRGQRIG